MDYLWGFIDKSGDTVIPHLYYRVSDFHEGLANIGNAIITISEPLIDKSNKWVQWPFREYYGDWYFTEGFARVCSHSNHKWGFIDKSKKSVVPPKYDEARHFSEGLAAVSLNGKWGFISR